ncbi:hypothetical protein L1049_021382 [Liquidambar formosana]|uniref:Uncharacterized protein n=1 Tax=Liquidambar formosana TaxID=63359 RepID=A0AAP0N4A8_LIQFO
MFFCSKLLSIELKSGFVVVILVEIQELGVLILYDCLLKTLSADSSLSIELKVVLGLVQFCALQYDCGQSYSAANLLN